MLIGCTSLQTTTITQIITTTPTLSSSSAITSTLLVHPINSPIHPDTGNITGRVLFDDYVTASQMEVWIFWQGANSIYATIYTDSNGNYALSNLRVGTYEIYTNHPHIKRIYDGESWYLSPPPDAVVAVHDQQVSIVPTIIATRH